MIPAWFRYCITWAFNWTAALLYPSEMALGLEEEKDDAERNRDSKDVAGD
jgi:hypothetical protein